MSLKKTRLNPKSGFFDIRKSVRLFHGVNVLDKINHFV